MSDKGWFSCGKYEICIKTWLSRFVVLMLIGYNCNISIKILNFYSFWFIFYFNLLIFFLNFFDFFFLIS